MLYYYGYRRTTGDIDWWIRPDNNENKQNLITALRNLNIDEDTLKHLHSMDFSLPLVFSDGEEPFRVDFMTQIQGVNFDEAWEKRVSTNIDGLQIAFIHFNHLVLSKIKSTRMKDKLDVEELQKISDQRKIKE